MAEPTPNSQGGIEPTPEPEEKKAEPSIEPDKDTDKAIKEAIAAAKAEWDKDTEAKIKAAKEEGARLAKLSAEERRKEEDKAAQEKFAQEKAEFEHEKLINHAQKQLIKNELPEEIAELITASDADADTIDGGITKLKEAFDKAVEKSVNEKLKGTTPKLGGSNTQTTGSFMDAIRKNQR